MRVALANAAWMSHAALGARRWRRTTRRVANRRNRSSTRILRPNTGTEFGRDHGVDAVRSIADFQRRVPMRTYDEVAPWIDRIAAGEPNVLTAAPVTRFGVTSGSSRASKLVPYTRALLHEFQVGIAPWAFFMFRRRPQLLRGTSYWSITPVAARDTHTRGGIPVGFEDERRYLGRAGRWVAETAMPMPSAVSRIEEIDRFRYVTLRLLLEQESLAWVSVWNPTFLTLLMDPLVGWHERLLDDLEAGTISAGGVPPEVLASARARPARARKLRADLRRTRRGREHRPRGGVAPARADQLLGGRRRGRRRPACCGGSSRTPRSSGRGSSRPRRSSRSR